MERAAFPASIALLLTACAVPDPGEARLAETTPTWRILNVADANADGLNDVYWVSDTRDELEVWLMNGAHVLAKGPRIPGPPGEGWRGITVGDFNRDGMIDILWGNADRSTMRVWLMNGTRLLAPGPEIHGPPGDGWAVVNAGDKDHDGLADTTWFNSTRHAMMIQLMDGAQLLARGPELTAPPGHGANEEWAVSNETDTNFDGMNDTIWNISHPSSMVIWLMNGTRPLAKGPEILGPPGDGWNAVTAADFNQDGMADVVWNKPGTMSIWLMNGVHVLAKGPEIPGPGPDWKVGNSGDCNGDGMADIAWQNADGTRMAIYLMNGAQVLAPGPEIAGPDTD